MPAFAHIAALALLLTAAQPVERERDEPAWRARCARLVEAARVRAQGAVVRELELRPLPASWDAAWTVTSAHYALRLTRSRAVGLALARDMDTMLGHFQALLGTDFRPARPFAIHVYPSLEEYNAFGSGPGAEHSSFFGSWLAPGPDGGVVVTYFDDNATRLRMWLTHGTLHQFLAAACRRPPPIWIDEGLASYFSLFWGADYGIDELMRLRAAPPRAGLFPLRELLAAPLGQYTERAHDRLIQLGMLFTYLLHYRADTRTESVGQAPFAEYLQLALLGEEVHDHPVHELFTTRLGELEADFNATSFGR